MIERYMHHGHIVAVMSELRGKHRDFCLCHVPCKRFKPNTVKNCPKAQRLYDFDCKEHMTTPVFECPDFE